jgi:hypothetical protein
LHASANQNSVVNSSEASFSMGKTSSVKDRRTEDERNGKVPLHWQGPKEISGSLEKECKNDYNQPISSLASTVFDS